MKKTRAIYIGDVKHNQCPIFELNVETGWYEMVNDTSFRYEKECVNENEGFLLFEVDGDDVTLTK